MFSILNDLLNRLYRLGCDTLQLQYHHKGNRLQNTCISLPMLIIILLAIHCPNIAHCMNTFAYSSGPVEDSFTFSDCDRLFVSSSLNSTHGTQNGSFAGPIFTSLMQEIRPGNQLDSANNEAVNGTGDSNPETVSTTEGPPKRHPRQCIYKFVAGPNERVKVSFTKFSLRSEAPECLDEYIDIYAEIKKPDSDLLSTPFGGRYCDQIIPHDRISLYQTIVISYYTENRDRKSRDHIESDAIGSDIFKGTYEFINAMPYLAGTQIPNEVCSYAIYSDQKREGEFMSPTYPGVYPKDLNCYYLFKGVKGQRVKLEFMDFDLYYGGSHCPFDYIKIYDGDSDQAPLINTYCGQQRQLFVFSSGTSLFVQFTTLKRISDSQNRGFSGYYEFSEKFVNLGFISNNENSEHILGTECDQKILSRKESNGTIYAPNYPFLYHSNIMCKYYIYGLQDAQHLERINFHFEMLQIPTKDVNECTDAYVRLYTQIQAMDEFDYVFCGETIPPPVVSDGPVLLVVFNSGSTQGQGFKAHYWFETDYKIPGTQASPGQCHFSYVSSSSKQGDFNSPRHPSNYPSNTYCVYEFFGEPDEQVKLVFNHFKFSDSEVANLGVAGYNEVCNRDWVEIYSIDPNGIEMFYGRFCSYTAPGPIITEKGINQMKVVMNTDENEVSSGFNAVYQFLRTSDIVHNCGGNFTNLESGLIMTPNFPNSYPAQRQVCNWFIIVRPGYRVLLHFETFSVEGDQAGRGCSGAVVRVWPNINFKPIELCGDKLSNDSREFISESNVLRLSFITAQKSVGAQGFMAIWNEISLPIVDQSGVVGQNTANNVSNNRGKCFYQPMVTVSNTVVNSNAKLPPPPVNEIGHFHCEQTGYCISAKLHCNGIQNCGFGDSSDEENCIREARINLLELVGGLAGLTMFIFFTIGVICLTAILIANWYRRAANDVKNGGKCSISPTKNCQHHFAGHGRHQSHLSTTVPSQDYPNFYQSELNTMSPSTPHRVIEVMTVSSGSTNTTQGKSKWSLMGNNVDSSHHHHLSHHSMHHRTVSPDQDHFLPDSESIPTASSPIPPPPPPPSSANRNALASSRQSSLANFYSENFMDPTTSSTVNIARSSTSIDRNYSTYSGYRSRSGAGSSAMTATLNRQTPFGHNGDGSRSAASTFGYPNYHTLSGHASGYSVQPPFCTSHTLQRNSRAKNSSPGHQQHSNSADPNEIMMDNMGENGNNLMTVDDDDTELSLRMGISAHNNNGGMLSDNGLGVDDCLNGGVGNDDDDCLMMDMSTTGNNSQVLTGGSGCAGNLLAEDYDPISEQMSETEQTSLRKYQLSKMVLMKGDQKNKADQQRLHGGGSGGQTFFTNPSDSLIMDDTI